MATQVHTQDIDKGWNRIKRELESAKNSYTLVGFPGNGDPFTSNPKTDIAARAAVNEYGSIKRKIPSRPFMRQAFDNNVGRIQSRVRAEYNAILDGKSSARMALGRIGEFYSGVIKATVTRGSFIPNKPYTVSRKGSSRPLIDTGEMRAAVTHKEIMK